MEVQHPFAGGGEGEVRIEGESHASLCRGEER